MLDDDDALPVRPIYAKTLGAETGTPQNLVDTDTLGKKGELAAGDCSVGEICYYNIPIV